MTKLYILAFFICSLTLARAQQEIPMPKVPLMRQIYHSNIDSAQSKILHANGNKTNVFKVSEDISINQQSTQILTTRINNLQAKIELDSTISINDKITWLKALEDVLRSFNSAYGFKSIKGIMLGDVVLGFEQCMKLQLKNQSMYPVVANNEYEVGKILVDNPALKNNKGNKASRNVLVLKLCQRSPNKILAILKDNSDVPFADSLIKLEALKNQELIYDYASTQTPLGRKIQTVQDPLVKTIGLLALMNSGRVYFPFLDKLYLGTLSLDSVAKIKDDEEAYYKLLVKTQVEYAERMQHGDTPLVRNVLVDKLRSKGIETYINEINALHDEKSDAVRFKKIEKLTPVELYYLCVLGEQEIYTSSYLGVYKRIFERMKVPRADSLLDALHYDHYKKFIKLASAYNTLDDFLKKMDKSQADKMMRNFVNGLEQTATLEDAVDVADSYASINTGSELHKLILDETAANLARTQQNGDKRGETIYNILNTIFLSMDEKNNVDVAAKLGINPIFMMPNSLLKDTGNGRIIVQQFFYGDKDGNNVFNAFVSNFRNPNWKITTKPEWVEVKAMKGTPITIYANKPLDELKDLDAQAQAHLVEYLDSLSLYPSFYIHRGHSYYVKSTIEQIQSSAKVVLLGSCGGYQSLNKVLRISPQAQIISSKQTGTGIINQGMINLMMEEIRLGKDLNWPAIWARLEGSFKGDMKEKFDDYVPPHKNLGAIFIMAYNKASDYTE